MAVAFSAASFGGSPTPIGVATAPGSFLLEGSRVRGNATLFDGARVETPDVASELRLAQNLRVQLAARSVARVWQDRLEVERGSARILLASRVLAHVPAGGSIRLGMQQTVTRQGCLLYKEGGFLLQVDDSTDVLQLSGTGLAQNVGSRVQVTGLPGTGAVTISPATALFDVSAVSLRAAGGCLTAAAALNAQTTVPSTPVTATIPARGAPPTVAGGGGMSTGAKVAIIGAIGGGGAGAALVLAGKKDSTSP